MNVTLLMPSSPFHFTYSIHRLFPCVPVHHNYFLHLLVQYHSLSFCGDLVAPYAAVFRARALSVVPFILDPKLIRLDHEFPMHEPARPRAWRVDE
jgi:hypothetical protein